MRRRRRQLVGIGSGTCSLFTSILLLLVLFGASDGEDHRAIDRAALLLFKGSVSSDPAGLLRGWKDSLGSDHCSWPGVSCDARFRVSALEIAGVGTADAGDRSLYSRRLWRWKCAHTARRLSGRLSPAVGRLSELRILALPCHSFDGEIPSEIWELQNLEVLDLQGNSVSGFLPSRFPGALRVLNLAFNRIGGEVPLSLSRCLNLEMVDLSRNQITGAVPPFLGRLPKLRVLSLASNRLRGSLPAEIGDGCQSLEHLDLSGNLLIKRIPARLGNCGELRSLLLFSNFLRGFLPPEIGRLTKLQVLDVSRNRLRGPVPEEIGNCTEISVLILSNCNPLISPSVNRSSGHGDDSNEFDGGLPASIVNLSKLRVLRAPWSLPLKGVIPQSSRSRRLAGGASTQSYSNGTPPPLAGESGRVMNSVEIAAVTSATVIVSVLFGLIIYYFYKRKCAAPRAAAADSSSLSRELTLFTDIGVPLTYEKVVRATGGFNSSNCIGSGGFGATYKAELAGGVIVAIKRLAVGRFNAGVQQFHAEIKTLGRWRHPNLVTLIGYHCSESEMFLIYNFLPGGNLERFIQSRAASAPDWRRLHCIALDVAQALAYLHDECSPRILHRDVKPSNILLDKELKAYLSDFGLARLLGSSETHATTGVAGTFGYVAPEYAMTCRVSDKADVYSYGVVLLELLSDKKALDPSFSQYGNGFNLVTWAAMMLRRGQAREFFAAGLWDAAPHDDLVETLHLGVSCTSDVTTGRPTMKHVVQRLKQLRPPAR